MNGIHTFNTFAGERVFIDVRPAEFWWGFGCGFVFRAIDEHTRLGIEQRAGSKFSAEAAVDVLHMMNRALGECGQFIKTVVTDHARPFSTDRFGEACEELGIYHELRPLQRAGVARGELPR